MHIHTEKSDNSSSKVKEISVSPQTIKIIKQNGITQSFTFHFNHHNENSKWTVCLSMKRATAGLGLGSVNEHFCLEMKIFDWIYELFWLTYVTHSCLFLNHLKQMIKKGYCIRVLSACEHIFLFCLAEAGLSFLSFSRFWESEIFYKVLLKKP